MNQSKRPSELKELLQNYLITVLILSGMALAAWMVR